MRTLNYLVLSAIGIMCVYQFWTQSWSPSMHAKALIHFYLSIPSSSSSSSSTAAAASVVPRLTLFNSARPLLPAAIVSKYMLQLYHRRPNTDIIRALQPEHISGPLSDGSRILEFTIPSVEDNQSLETAELLAIAGTIIRVRSFEDVKTRNGSASEISQSRRHDVWRAFNVTSAVAGRSSDHVKLYVHGRMTYSPRGDGPILLLNYNKTDRGHRQRRSVREQVQEWDQENELLRAKRGVGRRRRKDSCRLSPFYVNFTLIAYEWVVAPLDYNAYQCVGKCYLPLSSHLHPTKHAVLQTMMHRAIEQLRAQGDSNAYDAVVHRACCVPTRLDSISLLYMKNNFTIYEYEYEDMVVVECGCR